MRLGRLWMTRNTRAVALKDRGEKRYRIARRVWRGVYWLGEPVPQHRLSAEVKAERARRKRVGR